MTRKRYLVVVIALAVAVGLVMLIPPWRLTIVGYLTGEPRFHGLPAGYWDRQLAFAASPARDELRAGGDEAIPVLSAVLQSSRDTVSRMWAAKLLGEIDAPPAVVIPTIEWCLLDKDELVRNEVALALANVGQRDPAAVVPIWLAVMKRLRQKTPLPLRPEPQEVWITANQSIARMGPAAVPALTAALDDEVLSTIAVGLLASNGVHARPVIPRLLEFLKQPDTGHWPSDPLIAETLGEIGDKSHVPILCELAGRNGFSLKYDVYFFDVPQAIEKLAPEFDSETTTSNRNLEWTRAIEKLGPEATNAFIAGALDSLRSDQAAKRIAAIHRLGDLSQPPESVKEAISKALNDQDEEVREAAQQVLDGFDDGAAAQQSAVAFRSGSHQYSSWFR